MEGCEVGKSEGCTDGCIDGCPDGCIDGCSDLFRCFKHFNNIYYSFSKTYFYTFFYTVKNSNYSTKFTAIETALFEAD